MLIDCTYFTAGPRHIQNATLGVLDANAQEVCAAIETYIDKYQKPFLRGVLGDAVSKQALEYIKSLDDDGAERDVDFDIVLEQLKEPLANYVYYKILRDSGLQATLTGVVRLKSANTYVSPIKQQVIAWNEMVEAVADFKQWCDDGECPIPEVQTSENFTTKINTFNL